MMKSTFFTGLRKSRTKRIIAAFLAINLLVEIASPTMALALTSGPANPEFSSFEPVATTDMVNDFSGDFTYNIPVLNIPGPDGGGYSMSLSYHSGTACEDEASWVGFGWTLNPGAINRNKRGYPDEFNGVNVTNYNKTKPNWTQSSKFDFNMEYVSKDKKDKKKGETNGKKKGVKFKLKFKIPKGDKGPADDDSDNASGGGGEQDKNKEDDQGGPPFPISVSFSKSIKYNNYSGFSIATGIGVGAGGMGNVSMNSSGGQKTLGFSVNPMAIMSEISKKRTKKVKENELKKFDKAVRKLNKFNEKVRNVNSKFRMPTSYSLKTYNTPGLSYSVAKNSAASWNFSASLQINPNIPVGFQIGMAGNMHIQAMEPEVTQAAYGYMYSAVSNTNTVDNQLFDYQVEKETTFNKHDKYLGIPFNNADVFSATGNNVTGGFRFQHSSIGSFYPNFSTNETKIRQLSIELGVGATFQLGIDVGIGKQKTIVSGKWKPSQNYSGKEFSTALPKLRFTSDMGGEVDYDGNYDNLLYATIDGNKDLDLSAFNLNVNTSKNHSSSGVDYTPDGNGMIGGIQITNKDGGKSYYNQPVYTRKEANLTIGLDTYQDGKSVVTNPLYFTNPMDNNTVVGSKTDQQYANAYLLTGNVTANYVDVAPAGFSNSDFGGWTKFDYRQKWGGGGQWYRFRSPYNGLNYDDGRMLDIKDQTGSMSCGEKEIYYLKTIETKSHIAFFVTNKTTMANFTTNFPQATYPFLYGTNNLPIPTVTASIEGSNTVRYDGLDAAPIHSVTGKDLAAESLTAKGTHDLEKLERIVLFAKSDMTHPLTTTFLEYDYSLVAGIPNTTATATAPTKDRGKLTLKRLWTESNGVNRSQIAPYQFHYEYFNNYGAAIVAKYGWATGYNAMPSNDANQNPLYAPEQLDAWGNYQEDGAKRFANRQNWVSQKSYSTNTTFDPAAWQLKRIQLPSGGEIHVHYEQKDYSSVQDKLPMAMVSLLSAEGDGYKSGDTKFAINMDDLDIGTGVTTYSNALKSYFLEQNNKLYFKVLYSFCGEDTPELNSGKIRYEYVTGYTTVNDVKLESGQLYLYLGDKRNKLATTLKLPPGKFDKTLPRFACYQTLLTNGGQNLGMNASSYKDDQFVSEAYFNEDLKKVIRNRVTPNTLNMFFDWVGGEVKNVPKGDACKTINPQLSYFKLPVYNAKKGGGIRVKRLLTYDNGIAGDGDVSIYGSEYIYEDENGASSGVATNEPGGIREENALVVYLERKKQKFIDKLVNGKDTKESEGFLGESILPSAEVVHSRIVIKNIRDGQSTSGYAINKYFTVKDYPMEVEYSDISKKNDTYKKMSLSVPTGMFNATTNRAWVTQGYIFKMNDMNGKIASKTTYPGIYDPARFSNPTNVSTPYNRSNPFKPLASVFFKEPTETKQASEPSYTSKTIYNYSQPGEKIASLVYNPSTKVMTKAMLNPGMEEDFTMLTSKVAEKTNDFSIEVDMNVSFMPIVITVGFGASFSLTDNFMCQHVTSKVVSKKSYLMSTTTINDGVTQTTENLAFDKYTGDPVFTRTFDGYQSPQEKLYTQGDGNNKHKGYFYSLNIPASWVYSGMGQKSQNPANLNQLSQMAGNVVTYGSNTMYDAIINPTVTATTWNSNSNPLTNVVSASATEFQNTWFTSGMSTDYAALGTPTVLTEVNKFYYPLRTYAYRDNVTDANTTGGKIYSTGVVSTSFSFFDWTTLTHPSQWYSDSKVTKYSPYGYPVEEEDALAIKSSAQFGYENTLPIIVAQNAAYAETRFTDFEHGLNPSLTPFPKLYTKYAHSGFTSYHLSLDPNYKFATSYPVTANILSRGLSIKLWLKSSQNENNPSLNYNLKNPAPQLKALIGNKNYDFKAIAQTGDWTLYSADIQDFKGLAAGSYNVQLGYNFMPNELVLVDDFRIQPLDASMNCSVYNPDNKLAVQFDDQHFGVFYEYNGKGQLVRKSIETERGKKTLQEQQYNTPLITR
jgi:hypothetical protein